MRNLLFWLLIVPCILGAQTDGTIISRGPSAFEPFSKVAGVQRYATESEYASVVDDKRFVLERIVYASDGLPVVAYLYRPASAPGRRLPAIIFSRGGFRDTKISLYAAMMRRLCDAGFVVIAPMLRGSEGAPGEDELGGADLHDLMAAAKLSAQLDIVETSNLFLYGESRGGMMTYQATRDGFPARAAAVVGAYTDQAAMVEGQPELKKLTDKLWAKEKPEEALQRRSALQWAGELSMPVLIQHGSNDGSVAVGQSLQMATQLQRFKRPHRLIVYQGDGHVLTRNREQRDRAVIEWFRDHMER